jgi:hypothetical protein
VEEATVTIRGVGYAWDRKRGLAPAAVLAIWPWLARLAAGWPACDRADALQAAAVGALRAARTYDPAFGRTFLSWATPRARSEMRSLAPRGQETVAVDGDFAAPPNEAPDAALLADRILGRMPAADAALLADHFGMRGAPASVRALAARNGVSVSSMARRIARALHGARTVAAMAP